MNHYEFFGILSGTYADTEVGALVSQLEETIKKHTETIHYVQNLGRRKLAYPIKHQGHGTYVLIEFDADGEAIKKLDRLFRLTSELLRHCIVRRKTVGNPLPLERKEEESRPRPFDRVGMRKTLGEELLGETPTIETINETTETKPVENLIVEELIAPSPADNIPPAPEESSSVSNTAQTSTSTPPEEDTADETKKKGQKVSYEELDKKLNELLSDDII